MTKKEKEIRRIRGLQMILDRKKQVDVAAELNVTEGAVSQWVSSYEENGWDGLKTRNPTGPKLKFLKEHSEKLFEIISKSPLSWGYSSDLWTISMARDILYGETNKYFGVTRILKEFHNFGFSFQKPEVRAYEKKRIK